jgi:hypothetical protein
MQTANGLNPATLRVTRRNNPDKVWLYLQEEQSSDDETRHDPEALGVLALWGDGPDMWVT